MGVCEKGVRCRGAEESQPSSCHQECEERESQERREQKQCGQCQSSL